MNDEVTKPDYSDRAGIMKRVCDLIADGRSMKQISGRDGIPNNRTLYVWMRDNEEFRKQYEDAQEEQAEFLAHEIIEIADFADDSNSVSVQAARLKVDVRRWVAEKLYARRFGNKQQLDLTGTVKVDHEATLEAARKRRESGREQS